MITPTELLEKCKRNMKREWKIAFVSAFILGLLIHMPVMLMDVPNHDGLSSMYFDQNMITSGRWFLTVACGASSYFTLPWVIGLLGMFYLACAAVVLTELLELRDTLVICLVSGLLVSFPALASTFAYVFTLDGYMLALLLAITSVLLTKKSKWGFLQGAVCLAFSLGIYQAYVSFAMILCIYSIVTVCMEEMDWKQKCRKSLAYLYMGVIGMALYFVILKLLLWVQGKELAGYQGISGMSGGAQRNGLLSTMKSVYMDFGVFTLKGNVLFNNLFSVACYCILLVIVLLVLARLCFQRKWWKKPGFFVIMVLLILGLPVATNAIMFISPSLTYHLLIRYQWVIYPILLLAFTSRFAERSARSCWMEWAVICAGAVLVFNYTVSDHIGYANLQRRYEKTYAYCVRLLDRIEQTEGYYQGIPIAMVGVVGTEEFPVTDITEPVTGNMIGLSGDTLLYTADNYETFMKNYLGATLNFLDVDTVGDIYYSEEYIAMDSFPGENSVKVVDGIMYVKTENATRD